MAIPIHRHGDARTCKATTEVKGQSTVYANSRLVSVNKDPNTDKGGDLIADCNEVYINGKLVVIVGNSANPDALCPEPGGAHCAPASSSGSGDVFVGA